MPFCPGRFSFSGFELISQSKFRFLLLSLPKFLLLLFLLALPQLVPAQRRATVPKSTQRNRTSQPAALAPKRQRSQPKGPTKYLVKRNVPGQAVAALPAPSVPAFIRYLHSPWVDSLMRVLTPDQRAAQMFMVAAYSNRSGLTRTRFRRSFNSMASAGLSFFRAVRPGSRAS